MHHALVQTGRRLLISLAPGDDVIPSIAEACRAHGIAQAVIVTFSGALRGARLIATDTPPIDPELPLPTEAVVEYIEGIGSGTVTTGQDGELSVHVHIAMGVKDRSALGVAGHLISGEAHYVVEVALDEVLSPALDRRPGPQTHGVPALVIGGDEPGSGHSAR